MREKVAERLKALVRHIQMQTAASASPSMVARGFGGLLLVLSAITSSIGTSGGLLLLNENQILYLFSTSAQVLAGIYGLTLTGFIFFRNELSREEFEDETLTDAVESLKQRYFSILLFVSALVFVSLALSNLAISYEGFGGPHLGATIINTAQSAFLVSLLAIGYFIFDVISPKRIEFASKKLQVNIDPREDPEIKGSLERFIRNYNQIEGLLIKYGSIYQPSSFALEASKNFRKISNARLAEILVRNERIGKSLFTQLKELITLRNAIIHGADPVVSVGAEQRSESVLSELRAALLGTDNWSSSTEG